MRILIAMLLGLGVGLAGTALAQEKKAPTAAQKKQQSRLADCTRKAGSRQGRERQEFISSCLKGVPARSSKTRKSGSEPE